MLRITLLTSLLRFLVLAEKPMVTTKKPFQYHNLCRPRNCAQAVCFGSVTENGPTWLYINNDKKISASCEVGEGGGWTVIQRRNTGLLDFDRYWAEYKIGFGKHGAQDEMWFGTENIYQLTAGIGQGVHVRFELTASHTSKIGVTQYGDFRVYSEMEHYGMTIGREIGNIAISKDSFKHSNRTKFGTEDNDTSANRCASSRYKNSGGWWWVDDANFVCSSTNINGLATGTSGWDKMVWLGFNEPKRLSSSKMMIRPMDYLKIKDKLCYNPCQNNGSCYHVHQTGVYRCNCPLDYYGAHCEIPTVRSRAVPTTTTTAAPGESLHEKIAIAGSVVAFSAILYVVAIMIVYATNMMAWVRENMPRLSEKEEKEEGKENEKGEEPKEEKPKKKMHSSHKRSPKKKKRRGHHTIEAV